MAKYTAYNLVRAVSLLPRNTNYNYVNPRTPGLIHIENVNLLALFKYAVGTPAKVKTMLAQV